MDSCLICHQTFATESIITHCRHCVYKYHKECLEDWFTYAPIEKSFECMVCKKDLYFEDTHTNFRPYFKKLEQFFNYSCFIENLRWIVIYTLYVAIANLSACLYSKLGNYIILHYKPTIDSIIQTEYLLNMVFVHLVYPMIPYFYDIVVFQKYLKRFYTPDDIEDFRLIFSDCHKLITIAMTSLFFLSYITDKKYISLLLH